MSSISQRTYGVDAQGFGSGEESYLINYLLHLADDVLILGHRNSEWCGHAPILELDIAMSNIALDLIGQARSFYQYAAELINHSKISYHKAAPEGGGLDGATEDTLAYHRDSSQFYNCLLVEQPKGDWGVTVARQFLFSTYQYYLYNALQCSPGERIAAIAAKALKEVTYHVRWSSEWLIRLGVGTQESHMRMLAAVAILKPFTAELFTPADYEAQMERSGTGVDITGLQPLWQQKIQEVFIQAALEEALPLTAASTILSGKKGQHTQHLEQLLAEMQYLQRTYPGAEW